MATVAGRPSRESIAALLGQFPARVALDAEEMERVDCGSYIRSKVRYRVGPSERVTAFVCVPKEAETPTPAMFCHHQHAGNFALGKSEVVGLAGDPDQAYASELAEQGFITIAPDAIGFEERNWSPHRSENISWFELSTRLVRGQTLLASCLHDITVALDYLVSRPEVDPERIGFIGHSYGGRTALWAAAFDQRIRASVSHCGCIPYRLSFTHDTGIQAEFVVPGFAQHHDVDDVIACFQDSALLISATTDDRWSRGAHDVFANARNTLGDNVELALYGGQHVFTAPMREHAYQFLRRRLWPRTSARPVPGSP